MESVRSHWWKNEVKNMLHSQTDIPTYDARQFRLETSKPQEIPKPLKRSRSSTLRSGNAASPHHPTCFPNSWASRLTRHSSPSCQRRWECILSVNCVICDFVIPILKMSRLPTAEQLNKFKAAQKVSLFYFQQPSLSFTIISVITYW